MFNWFRVKKKVNPVKEDVKEQEYKIVDNTTLSEEARESLFRCLKLNDYKSFEYTNSKGIKITVECERGDFKSGISIYYNDVEIACIILIGCGSNFERHRIRFLNWVLVANKQEVYSKELLSLDYMSSDIIKNNEALSNLNIHENVERIGL